MKLVIFGASGSIGRQLALQALAQGHEVTAFVRSKEKLNEIEHPHLYFAIGDVLDSALVKTAVKGQDIVLCALGAGRRGIVRSEGTKNIIRAMEESGVSRLICQTTLGCGDSRGNLNFFWKYIMFGWFLKEAFKDHEIQEQHIINSKLEWTIVRPAAFIDGKVSGEYKHGFPATDKSISAKISRPDVALFMLQQITDLFYLRKTPGLSY